MPKLKEVLSLRGIRVDDMESLEAHAFDISRYCESVMEVYAVGREVIEQIERAGGPTLQEREQSVKDLITCHAVVSGRMVELLSRLHAALCDLTTYIASSKAGIEKRRALMLDKDRAEFRPRTDRPVRGIR
jgi:hypothetical protein